MTGPREIITLETDGERLDLALARHFPEESRSAVKRWFDAGRVLLDGKPAKAGAKSHKGQVLSLEATALLTSRSPQTMQAPAPLNMTLDIRFEDEYLLVINKPQGLVVHPAPGHWNDTLVNALVARYGGNLSKEAGMERPGIVHRIDKDTSGLLLIVKDPIAHRKIAADLRRHAVRRCYMGLAHGYFNEHEGSISAPLARSSVDRQKMAVRAGGREATTHFTVWQRLRSMSLLELELETGRTHQIRVHLQYIGHPLVGDPIYAGKRETYGLRGQALHAWALDFKHPISNENVHVEAPLPDYFCRLIAEQGGDLAALPPPLIGEQTGILYNSHDRRS